MIISLIEGVCIAVVMNLSYQRLARVLRRRVVREWLVQLCGLTMALIIALAPVILVEAIARRLGYHVPWVEWAFWVGFLPTYTLMSVKNG